MASSINQNFSPAAPQLKDLLDLLQRNIMFALNCHHIGTVQSFSAAKQTAQVTINYPKTIFRYDTAARQYLPVDVTYPVLVDCPVICLGGGTSSLTFPVTAGDECLVLFNDADFDTWFTGGTGARVSTPRQHSFSDALVLVGVRSSGKVLTNYDAARAVLRNGTNGSTMVGVGATLVKIANNSTTLNTLLQSLVTQIENLVTQCALITVTGVTAGGGVSGVPANAAAITAVGTSLATLATQISGLLE